MLEYRLEMTVSFSPHALIRWLCSFFFISAVYADVALPTQQLRIIKIEGTIELNCESDQVFQEVFKLFSGTKNEKRFYNIVSKEPAVPPGMFLAWDNIPEERPARGKLVLKDPTLWELLERAGRERGRRLIDLSYGVVFLERGAHIQKVSEVVKKLEASGEARGMLEMFAPSQLQLVDVGNSREVIEFINGLLKRTGGLTHSSHVLQIQAEQALPLDTNNNIRERATLMGYWRYVDLLHVYGSLLGEEFSVEGYKIIMRPRDLKPPVKAGQVGKGKGE